MVQLDINVAGAQQSTQQINQVTIAEQQLIAANQTLDAILLQTFQGFTRLTAAVEATGQSTRRTTEGVKKTSSALEQLASITNTILGLGAIKRVYEFAKAWLEAGASAEKVANQFKTLAMIRPDLNTSGIEQASRGLATQRDLIGSINKAAFFGFDLSNKQLNELVKLSTKTAIAMGEDVKYMFDSLITGTARESGLILDNLGIIIDMKDVYDEAAVALGKTSAEMTKAEKQTALLNKVIEELNNKTANIDLDKMGTKMQSALKKYNEGFTELFEGIATTVWDVSEAFGGWLADESDLERIARLQKEADRLGISLEALIKIQDEENKKIAEARPVYLKLADAVAQLNAAEIKRLYDLTALQGQQAEWFRERVKMGFEWVNKVMPKAMVFSEKESEAMSKQIENEKKLANERAKAQAQREKDWEWSVANADIGIMGGFVSGIMDLDSQELQFANAANLAQQFNNELLQIQQEFDDAAMEVRAQNNELRLAQMQEFYQEQEQMARSSYDLMESFSRATMDAILKGQAEKIPLILANQAYQYGMDLFWDGVKTLWMGNAKNALFPGLGTDAVGVGLTEMAIGGAMAGAGAVGAQAFGGGSGGGSAGSQERMTQEKMTLNIVTEVSLYGSKKEAQRELTKVMGA